MIMETQKFDGFVMEVVEWLDENWSAGWHDKILQTIENEFRDICKKHKIPQLNDNTNKILSDNDTKGVDKICQGKAKE